MGTSLQGRWSWSGDAAIAAGSQFVLCGMSSTSRCIAWHSPPHAERVNILFRTQVIGQPNSKALAEIRDSQGLGRLISQARRAHPIPASHVIEYMLALGFEFVCAHTSGIERVVEFYRNRYEPPRDASPGVGDVQ